MTTPTSYTYNVSSGEIIYGGKIGLPSWVPAAGQFKNISLNTLYDARPTGWPNSDIAGPFANWSGGVYAPQFGSKGGYVIHGSGHLSTGAPLWGGVWVFDINTRTWVGRNVPNTALLEGGNFNGYFESQDAGTFGHTYPPHTYDGLAYQSPSAGGGTSGSLIRFALAGSGAAGDKCVHKFDLSSTTSAPTRVNNGVASIATSYPATATDTARGGVWVTSANGAGGVGFVDFATFSETRWASVDFNAYGDQSIIYVPTRDCLVAMGRDGGGGVNMSVRVCPIVGGIPQGWTTVTTSGTRPSDARCGGVWSTLLNCIVCYEAGGSYTVHKLTVPTNLTTDTWVWTSETLTGVSGVTPSRSVTADNGAWSRFQEAPEYNCFIWCDSVTGAVQAWRLTGM